MVDYDALGVKPHVEAAARELAPKFGITSIGGYRASATDPNGHPAGLALDMMCGRLNGDALAAYSKANYRRLSISYIIWRQRIWSVARAGEGWRIMEDRGSPTANHMDHVHLNFNASAGSGPVYPAPEDGTSPAGYVPNIGIPNPFSAFDDIFALLTDRDMWIRYMMFGAGMVLILMGLYALVKNQNSAAKVAKGVTRVATRTTRKVVTNAN